jgi:membrane fusion protein
MTLFRKEVGEAQTAQWLGSVRLHRPLSFTLVTGSALGIALLLVAFAAWGEVNRKARLSGLLVPALGTLNINAPQAGTVAQLPVTEGQTVQTGDVLLVINTERNSLRNGAADDTTARVALQIEARQQTIATERTLRELQSRQREQVLNDRIRAVQTELRQSEEECALLERRVQLAQTTLARNEQLAKDGFVSAAQVQARQEERIDTEARLQSAQRGRLSLQRDLQAVKAERDTLAAQLQADFNQLARTSASLEQEAAENTSRRSIVITAPQAGQVTALGLQAGQSVQAGQTLLTLLPQASTDNTTASAQLQAHLYAPSRTAGFVRPGQTVYMRYAAYPYQKFGLYEGRITAVSSTPFSPNELPPNLAQQLVNQAGSNEALYRINVKLSDQSVRAYGENVALKPGLTLEADVLQERRKVWEWVLEPVLAARQQVKVLNADLNQRRAGD